MLPSQQAKPSSSASSAQIAVSFPKTKCEFCDVIFKCDLDVSRHLHSEVHMKNVDKFVSLRPTTANNKQIQKEVPKNLSAFFENSIKVKNIKDIKDLGDKGYFNINPNDNGSTAQVADGMAKALLKAVVEHESKVLPTNLRQTVIDAVTNPGTPEPSEDEEEEQVIKTQVINEDSSEENPESPMSVCSNSTPPSETEIPATSESHYNKPNVWTPNPAPKQNDDFIPKISFWPGVKVKSEPKDK